MGLSVLTALVVLVSLCFSPGDCTFRIKVPNHREFVKLPNAAQGDYLLANGTSFNLRCSDVTPVNWSWVDPNLSMVELEIPPFYNISAWYDQKYKLHVANLEVFHSDAATYTCTSANNTASVFVYVWNTKLLASGPDLVSGSQYQSLLIPCRPNSPDVKVSLLHEEEDVLDRKNSIVTYDPKEGFTMKNINYINGGMYFCTGTRNNVTEDYFTVLHIQAHTDYVPKPNINNVILNYVVGSRIVLNCTVMFDAGITFSMDWKVVDNRGLETKRIISHNTTSYEIQDEKQKRKLFGIKLLTITRAQQSDTGVYECIVTDHTNKANSANETLTIFDSSTKYINLTTNGKNLNESTKTKSVQWVVGVSSYPKASLRWVAPNGKNISTKDLRNKYEVDIKEHQTILKITSLSIHDTGEYKLVAENGFISKELKFDLVIKDSPKVRFTSINHKFYMFDQTYDVICNVTAYPPPTIEWWFERCDNPPTCSARKKLLDRSIPETKNISNIESSSTWFMRATYSGFVTCVASNSEGVTSETRSIWVTDVQDGFAVEKSTDIDLFVGDMVTLKCGAVKYNHTDSIVWFPSELQGIGSLRKKTTDYSYNLELTINNLTKDNSGQYNCTVVDTAGLKYSKVLNVEVKVPIKPTLAESTLNHGSLSLNIGAQHHLKCSPKGLPPPKLTWFKDGKQIDINPGDTFYKSENQLQLFITNVEASGTYSCRAENRAGFVEDFVEINVKKGGSLQAGVIATIVILVVVLLVVIVILIIKIRKAQKLRRDLKAVGLDQFNEGALDNINPELPIDDQAELLPYDRKWEFPRDKLRLGKQLGAGAFGVVMKADAIGIIEGEAISVVAVKMVKRNADYTYIKALASELKIMVHLGKHLNVVNLLGACTKNLTKRELYVIVEYCRYGNLHNYLLRHRDDFINQVDPSNGQIDPSVGADIIARHESISSKARLKFAALSFRNRRESETSDDYRSAVQSSVSTDSGEVNSGAALISMAPTGGEDGIMLSNNSIQPEWRSNYRGDYKGNVRPICTRDVLCWAFQVARGMEYLSGRKVLHGDLAARNILLSDDNIVKICDFGLAKSMYKSDNYKKKGDGPLPVKWMAVESIRDRVFSTQSDVWSFGIVLWEFFSLARTPYPGMEADEKLYHKLINGYRMDKPEFATDAIYDTMEKCWLAKPTDRPSFGDLSEQLGNMLEEGVRMHYIDLNDPYVDMNSQRKENQPSDYLAMMTAPTYDNMVAPSEEVDGIDSDDHLYANSIMNNRDVPSTSDLDNSGYLCMSPVQKESSIFSPRASDTTNKFSFTPKDATISVEEETKPMLSNDYKSPTIEPQRVNNLNKESNSNTNKIPGLAPNVSPSFSNPSYQIIGAVPAVTTSSDNYVNMPNQKMQIADIDSKPNSNYMSMGGGNFDDSNKILFSNTKNEEGYVNLPC